MANKWIRQSIAITLVLLACVLPLQGPALRVGAHEDEHVHTFLSAEAAELLPKGSPMYAEISAYLEQIKDGAYQEDHHDLVYADLTHNIEGVRCIPHFWDADAGPGELVKDLWGVDRYPNAYQKALRLFQMALDAYPPVGDTQRPAKAYTLLGHVAHLLEDMTVPCHVHEDFHAGEWLPGGDDCFEDWYYDGDHRHPYKDWTAASALAQGGALYFPHTIAEEMREGDWATGLFYLMYTTNQHADYFASDDVDGDTHEPYGWVDYTGWPSSPTTHDQLGDNDHVSYMGEVTDNDNDGDGDMSAIANYSCVYGIRAVAALYRMFYEATHPPQVSMSIDYSDENGDGQADYPWVSLSLDYQAGADEYGHDLQVRYRNEGDEWTAWRAVSQRRSWFLPGGDGQKTVSCQVRNLLGLTGVASATASLKEVALPQLFEYQFSATGPASLHSTVDFYIRELEVWRESGDGNLELYLKPFVDDGAGNRLTAQPRIPGPSTYFEIGPWTEYGFGPGVIDLSRVVGTRMMGCDGGCVLTDAELNLSHVHAIGVSPGQRVRLRTKGMDSDTGPDDNLKGVWTGTYTVPDTAGSHVLTDRWFYEGGSGTNKHFSLHVEIVANLTPQPWSNREGPFEAAVAYGESEQWIADASEALRAPYCKASGHSYECQQCTDWYVVVDNSAIEYRLDGRHLYAKTADSAPDMVVVGLSPIHLMVIDPQGRRIGSRRFSEHSVPDPQTFKPVPVWQLESYDNVPGASLLHGQDVNGDGSPDMMVIFDHRQEGHYRIVVSPAEEADPASTYDIGLYTRWRKRAQFQPLDPQPPRVALVAQNMAMSQIPTAGWTHVIEATTPGASLPPRADAGGPYVVAEGTPLELDASNSTDPDSAGLQYRWDFDGDGAWDTAWSGSPGASHTWDDDWAGMVRLEVSDGELADTTLTAITVLNAHPAVDCGPNQLAAPGDALRFEGRFADAGLVDTHSILWDFGDGSIATGGLSQAHTYLQPGRYTVALTVTDDDGGVGRDTLQVNTAIDMAIEPPLAAARPRSSLFERGESALYQVRVQHLGSAALAYDLQLQGLDAGWYSLSSSAVELDAGEAETVTLRISPPPGAETGLHGFAVVATSREEAPLWNWVEAEVKVEEAVQQGPCLGGVAICAAVMALVACWRRRGFAVI